MRALLVTLAAIATLGACASNGSPDSQPLTPLSRYTAVDSRVGYRLNERMTVALAGQNLTRSEQRQNTGPHVERQIFATFSMTL